MPETITIFDETTQGERTTTFILELDTRRLSARELIRQRVKQEVAKFNAQRSEVFHGLVQPTETERELNGYRLTKFRRLDWERQFEAAIKSFEANGFFMLVNGKQVESLEEELELDSSSQVQFVKLVPLVGG